MLRDRFDHILFAGLLVTIVVLAAMLLTAGPGESNTQAADVMSKQLEREMAYQARLAFIERRYEPVIELIGQGALPAAMLKLEEVSRDLPGEVHSNLLRGDLLFRMGQVDQAVQQLALAVQRNGDYVDAASPLNQRELIESVVTQGMPLVRDRLRAQPDNRTLKQVLKAGYYLQSRLAGGCE